MPHAWTEAGVTIEGDVTGAHLLHLSVAACVLNDLYRESARSGVALKGVRVAAAGDFGRERWRSTGVTNRVEISSDAPADVLAELVAVVDHVAEIPRALRQRCSVTRVGGFR